MTVEEVIALREIEKKALADNPISPIKGLKIELYFRRSRDEWAVKAFEPTPQGGMWVQFLVTGKTAKDVVDRFNALVSILNPPQVDCSVYTYVTPPDPRFVMVQ